MSTSSPPTAGISRPDGGPAGPEPAVRPQRFPGLSGAALAAVIALCAIFWITSLNRLNHTDLWCHLNFGRWIAEHGRLPGCDPFRPFDAPGRFLNVPWLSQLLGYAWHQTLGLEGLVLAHALLVTLTCATIMFAVIGRGVSVAWAVAAGVAAYLLSLPVTGTIRPQLFGELAFALTLVAASQSPARRLPLVWLPLVFILWANLHGSFLMGLLVLGCFAAGHTWTTCRAAGGIGAAWRAGGVGRPWLALVLAAMATCVNPLGVHLLPAVAGFTGNTSLAAISEWRAMTLGSLSGALFFTSLVVTAVLLARRLRRIEATEVLLMLVFGLLCLTAIRMLIWWALVWPWVAARHAAALWESGRSKETADASGKPAIAGAAQKRLLFAVVLVVLTLWWSPPTFGLITGRPRPERKILSLDTPVELAGQLVDRGLGGRIFAPMDWADYLVWQTGGAVEPLVNAHVHLTSPEVWQDFLHIDAGGEGWLRTADKHGLKYLVISPRRQGRLAASAVRDPRCRLLYRDQQGLVLELASLRAAQK